MSVQWATDASQKLTCPTVMGIEPALTVAVRVTTLPCCTVATVLPFEVSARVVAVAAGAAETGCAMPQNVRKTTPARTAGRLNLDTVSRQEQGPERRSCTLPPVMGERGSLDYIEGNHCWQGFSAQITILTGHGKNARRRGRPVPVPSARMAVL